MLGREVLNSNTTLVKVKSSISFVSSLIAAIQIQHLLKLNIILANVLFFNFCIQIQHLLKLNKVYTIKHIDAGKFKYNTC